MVLNFHVIEIIFEGLNFQGFNFHIVYFYYMMIVHIKVYDLAVM